MGPTAQVFLSVVKSWLIFRKEPFCESWPTWLSSLFLICRLHPLALSMRGQWGAPGWVAAPGEQGLAGHQRLWSKVLQPHPEERELTGSWARAGLEGGAGWRVQNGERQQWLPPPRHLLVGPRFKNVGQFGPSLFHWHGAWQAAVHRVTQSQTGLKPRSSSSSSLNLSDLQARTKAVSRASTPLVSADEPQSPWAPTTKPPWQHQLCRYSHPSGPWGQLLFKNPARAYWLFTVHQRWAVQNGSCSSQYDFQRHPLYPELNFSHHEGAPA